MLITATAFPLRSWPLQPFILFDGMDTLKTPVLPPTLVPPFLLHPRPCYLIRCLLYLHLSLLRQACLQCLMYPPELKTMNLYLKVLHISISVSARSSGLTMPGWRLSRFAWGTPETHHRSQSWHLGVTHPFSACCHGA